MQTVAIEIEVKGQSLRVDSNRGRWTRRLSPRFRYSEQRLGCDTMASHSVFARRRDALGWQRQRRESRGPRQRRSWPTSAQSIITVSFISASDRIARVPAYFHSSTHIQGKQVTVVMVT